MAALLSDNEHGLLDLPLDKVFDDLVRLATHVCETPIAAVSLLETERLKFRAITGLDGSESFGDIVLGGAVFCAHTILQPDLMVVPDAQADPRFADDPLVTGDPNIRFYAGVPLITEDGHTLGTLCVIDRTPRSLTPAQQATLRLLARQVTSHLGVVHRTAERDHFFTLSLDMLCIAGNDGYFKRLNPMWPKTLGFSEAELLTTAILEFVHPEDRTATLDARKKNSQGILTPNFENRYRCRDGSYRWLRWNTVPDTETGLRYGVAHDITEYKQAEAALAKSEKRFRTSMDAMEEGLVLQDADGSFLFCNESAERILGLSMDQLTGRASIDPRWRSVYEDGTEFLREQHPAMVALRECLPQRNVIMGIRKPNDELTWVNINAVPLLHASTEQSQEFPKAHGVVVTFSDITERMLSEAQTRNYAVTLELQKRELEKANAELATLATIDGLTSLYNHRSFQERLAEEVSRTVRSGLSFSLILLDVDCFKQFNDTYGHPAGDAVLRAVAQMLQTHVRETDMVARYGGEEFVLILPQTGLAGAMTFAERLRMVVESHSWPVRAVTASFGVAVLRLGQESGADLIARADKAMYQSKLAGRNRVICDPEPPEFYGPKASLP